MNAFSSSWRAHAWLRTGLAAAALLGMLAAVWAVASRPSADARPSPSRAAIAGSGAATAPVGVAETATPRPPSPVLSQTLTPQVPADESAAESVARAFLAAYASYRYDDGPAALRARLRPYDTDAFDVGLAASGGGGAQDQLRWARHEVAIASVLQLTSTGLAPDGRLILVAQVSQQVSSDRGSSGSTRYAELYLAQTGAGWRVDEVAS